METLPVSQLLNHKGHEVVTTTPTATVREAIRTMVDHNVGSILVMEDGTIAGIFTERDYLRRIVLQGRTSDTTQIREVMTADLVTVPPSCTVGECMQLMTEHKCRHLPVVKSDGSLRGLVSIGDCVKYVSEQAKNEVESLRSYISGGYTA
ncbi:MAG: CBS domain-containing protein [Longimonas sp.]|uniref:CBS domain-containing protein n=1 Tax=Longimonas sp. TaxID=2039626 RepID=UPI0039767130